MSGTCFLPSFAYVLASVCAVEPDFVGASMCPCACVGFKSRSSTHSLCIKCIKETEAERLPTARPPDLRGRQVKEPPLPLKVVFDGGHCQARRTEVVGGGVDRRAPRTWRAFWCLLVPFCEFGRWTETWQCQVDEFVIEFHPFHVTYLVLHSMTWES